jgi:hypothetical protein
VLAAGCHFQAGHGIGDGAAVQGLEPHLGVLLLVGSRLLKDRCQLLIALLLGHAGEEGILVAGLALACKGFPQVFLGLGTLEFHIHALLLFVRCIISPPVTAGAFLLH